MKKYFCLLMVICLFACNQSTDKTAKSNSTDSSKAIKPATENKSGVGCGNSILFKEGTIIEGVSYDGSGNETGRSVSTVTKVSEEGGMTIAETESKTTKGASKTEKIFHPSFKCDGQNFIVDIGDLLREKEEGMSIEGSGISFPLSVSVGESLPDVNYTVNMKRSGREMKVSSVFKDRKVESKEPITVSGKAIEAYKISAVIDASIDMPGMTDVMKKTMEEAKKRMGQNKLIIWYAPEYTVLKMEFYLGEKLVSKNVVTAIRSK